MMKFVITDGPFVARSASFLWWKRVYFGRGYMTLQPRVQAAVMIHEMYHCIKHHTERRILALLTPWVIPRLCRQQELDADAFAAKFGYGPDLYHFLKPCAVGGPFHPSNDVRRQALLSRVAPVTGQTLAQSA